MRPGFHATFKFETQNGTIIDTTDHGEEFIPLDEEVKQPYFSEPGVEKRQYGGNYSQGPYPLGGLVFLSQKSLTALEPQNPGLLFKNLSKILQTPALMPSCLRILRRSFLTCILLHIS